MQQLPAKNKMYFFKFMTLFISSKTWLSFQRKDKHKKFGLVLVLQDLKTACSLEISVPEE